MKQLLNPIWDDLSFFCRVFELLLLRQVAEAGRLTGCMAFFANDSSESLGGTFGGRRFDW